MKQFIAEFKQFIMRGNVLDLAVGVIIGGAFQKIVTSVVSDIALPALSPFLNTNFADLTWGPVKIGNFLQATIDFLIIAFFIFIVVRVANRMKGKQEECPPPEKSGEEELLMEIRDLLKEGKKSS